MVSIFNCDRVLCCWTQLKTPWESAERVCVCTYRLWCEQIIHYVYIVFTSDCKSSWWEKLFSWVREGLIHLELQVCNPAVDPGVLRSGESSSCWVWNWGSFLITTVVTWCLCAGVTKEQRCVDNMSRCFLFPWTQQLKPFVAVHCLSVSSQDAAELRLFSDSGPHTCPTLRSRVWELSTSRFSDYLCLFPSVEGRAGKAVASSFSQSASSCCGGVTSSLFQAANHIEV